MFDEPNDDAGLTPAQRELESALCALRPARPDIDRDRMMFKAGTASARRSLNVWRVAAAFLVIGNVVAMSFAVRSSHVDRATQVVKTQTPQDTPTEQRPDEVRPQPERVVVANVSWDQPLLPSADAGYLPVRDAVLRWGVSALPAQAGGRRASAGSVDVRQLLELPELPEQQAPVSPWAPLSAPLRRFFSGDHL